MAEEDSKDVVLCTFPANCESGIGWETLRQILNCRGARFDRVELFGGGCLQNLSQPPADLAHVNLHRFEQCSHLVLPSVTVNHFTQQGSYVLTPGWLARWHDRIKQWGFNRETATEYFGEFATKLLLLDTGVNADSARQLQAFADYLSLPAEILPVNLEVLRLAVTAAVTKWRQDVECQSKTDALMQTNRQITDYAMAFDWIGNLPQLVTEEEVIDKVLEFLFGLFAPSRLVFASVVDGQPTKVKTYPSDGTVDITEVRVPEHMYEWTENEQGFLLRIDHNEKTVAVVRIDDLYLPQHKQQYLNLALTLAKVCGLVISNTRVLTEILPICANCKKIRDTQNQWHPIEEYLHQHSDIDFTHGLCPECVAAMYSNFYK